MGFCSNFAAKFETFNNSKNTIMTKKIFIIGLVLAAVLSMFFGVPGTEQWNIRSTASRCIKTEGLQAGESLVFINGTQHRYACEKNGRPCKDVAVKFTVKEADGSKKQRTIYMLLSENCKEVIDVHF